MSGGVCGFEWFVEGGLLLESICLLVELRVHFISLWCEKHRKRSFKSFFFKNLISGSVFSPLKGSQKLVILPSILLLHLDRRLYHFIVITVHVFQQLNPLGLA